MTEMSEDSGVVVVAGETCTVSPHISYSMRLTEISLIQNNPTTSNIFKQVRLEDGYSPREVSLLSGQTYLWVPYSTPTGVVRVKVLWPDRAKVQVLLYTDRPDFLHVESLLPIDYWGRVYPWQVETGEASIKYLVWLVCDDCWSAWTVSAFCTLGLILIWFPWGSIESRNMFHILVA